MATTRRINVDLPLIVTAVTLSLYGLAVVFSAGHTDVHTVATRTRIALRLSGSSSRSLPHSSVSRASVRLIEWMTVPAYAFTILLLVALLAGLGSGGGTARSTAGWLTIAGHRLGQPAEFAKLTVVLMLARVLAQNRVAPKAMIELWKPILVAGTPLLLIMAQGDLGTSIVFVGIFLAMLFWAGVAWQLLLLLASPVISLILGFDTAIWGAWFLALLALVLWYKPFLGERTLRRLGECPDGYRRAVSVGSPEAISSESDSRSFSILRSIREAVATTSSSHRLPLAPAVGSDAAI